MKRLTYEAGFNIFICLCMLIIVLFFSFQVVSAEQSGMETWDRTYGGNNYDSASSLIQTSDGGYAVAGYTFSKGAGGDDFWLLRLDKQGNKLWDHTYGGSKGDEANSLIQTSDGGYAVAGYTESKGAGGDDLWLLRLDKQGNKLWDHTYRGSKDDVANSLIQTSDGGYALAGDTGSKGAGKDDFWLLRLDKQGNKLWDRTYGGSDYDGAYSLIQTSDGGYALAGDTRSKGAGKDDLWLLRLDKQGNKLWDRTYGGSGFDRAYSLIQTSDGGYALAGCTQSYGAGKDDFWLLKLDSRGNKVWDKTYGGSDYDSASSLIQTSDGGYAVAGCTQSYGAGKDDFWLLRLDSKGNLNKIRKKEEIKTPSKAKTANLTLVVITPLSSVFSLKKHDLTVTIKGPTSKSKTFENVGTAKPVPVYFYNIPEGHYKVTAKYGSKKISKEINVSGDTLDLQMTFY